MISDKRFGFPVLAKVKDFTKLFDNVTTLDSSGFELNAEISGGVVVLKCPIK